MNHEESSLPPPVRFSGHHSRNTKHVCRPSHELHVSNLPNPTGMPPSPSSGSSNAPAAAALEQLVQLLANPPSAAPLPSVLPGARPGDGYIVSDPHCVQAPLPPVQVIGSRIFSGDSRMGFLRFKTLGDAALAIVALHDYPLGRVGKNGDAQRVKLTFAHM